jgi:hypothetical protein
MPSFCPRWAAGTILAAALVAAPRGAHAVADPSRVGFPSSDPADGKFLSQPSQGLSSLTVATHLSLGVPASQSASPCVVEIFDGDLQGKWDRAGGAVTTYELYTDRNRDGANMTLLASKNSSDASFPDDAWGTLYSAAQHPLAQAPSGNYFYRLVVTTVGDPGPLNGYKVALPAGCQISAVQNEFAVIGGVVATGRVPASAPYDEAITSSDPMPSIPPAAPNPANTYDGTFAFKIYVGTAGASVTLAEGDADHMTDATAAVASEAALPSKPGFAADGADSNVVGGKNVDYRAFKIGGPCGYRVRAPNGTVLATVTDPSGDAEYETVPQFSTAQVGYYTMEWFDLDMRNTVFLKPAFGVEVFSAESAPTGAPLATGLGGLRGVLFQDRNGNGVQDAREPGLAGVPVDVKNLDTSLVTTVVTNAYGEYAAGVPAGPYGAAPSSGSSLDAALDTTIAGPTPVVTVVNGQTKTAASGGFTDPTHTDPNLPLVPECRGTLTHVGLDVVLDADLTGRTIQVQYLRAGTHSLYDVVTFVFNGRFSQPVLGFNRNLRVVNVWVDAGQTHVVVDTSASSRGAVRRTLRAGDVAVLAGVDASDSGILRPVCRPSYLRHGQVVGGDSTVKSLR